VEKSSDELLMMAKKTIEKNKSKPVRLYKSMRECFEETGQASKLYGGANEFLAEEGPVGARAYLNGAIIKDRTIELPNSFFKNRFKGNYGPYLEDFWGKGNVKYVNLKQGSLPLRSVPVDYTKLKNDNLMELCSKYDHVERRLEEDPDLIVHGGNYDAYRHVRNLVDSFEDKKRKGSCSIINGENGFGKSSLAEYFAYMLREKGIPTVAFSVDDLGEYLRPSNKSNNYDPVNKCIIETDYCLLAKNTAKVVILDQGHGLFGGTGNGKWNRSGVQKRIFDLVESVKRRGGHVLFSITETKASGLEDMTAKLKDDVTKDVYEGVGHRDLGSRFEGFANFKVSNIPKCERELYTQEILERSSILKNCGVSKDEILGGLMAASYGIRLTPRKISDNIGKLEAKVWKVKGMDDVVRIVGGKKAIGKMQRDGLSDFITEGVLTGEDLKKILTDNPYGTSDIWDASHDHRYNGFKIGEKVLDEEI